MLKKLVRALSAWRKSFCPIVDISHTLAPSPSPTLALPPSLPVSRSRFCFLHLARTQSPCALFCVHVQFLAAALALLLPHMHPTCLCGNQAEDAPATEVTATEETPPEEAKSEDSAPAAAAQDESSADTAALEAASKEADEAVADAKADDEAAAADNQKAEAEKAAAETAEVEAKKSADAEAKKSADAEVEANKNEEAETEARKRAESGDNAAKSSPPSTPSTVRAETDLSGECIRVCGLLKLVLSGYELATTRRLFKLLGCFCKRALPNQGSLEDAWYTYG